MGYKKEPELKIKDIFSNKGIEALFISNRGSFFTYYPQKNPRLRENTLKKFPLDTVFSVYKSKDSPHNWLLYSETGEDKSENIRARDYYDLGDNPTDKLMKKIEYPGKISGMYIIPESDLLFYKLKTPDGNEKGYVFNLTQGAEGDTSEFVIQDEILKYWGSYRGVGFLHYKGVKSYIGNDNKKFLFFTFDQAMDCQKDYPLGNCSICEVSTEKKGICRFCITEIQDLKDPANTCIIKKKPDEPPKPTKECPFYYSQPKCFKLLHPEPFRYIISFSRGRSYTEKPHLKIDIDGKDIYMALKNNSLIGSISLSLEKERRQLSEGKDPCGDVTGIPKITENSISLFFNISQSCLDDMKNSNQPRKFRVKIGNNGGTDFIKFTPADQIIELTPSELKIIAENSKGIEDMPEKPTLIESFGPQNIANFSYKGVANKTTTISSSGSLISYIGYLATPIYGISLITITISMSFMLKVVQKFDSFNTNYGEYMGYFLEIGEKDKRKKEREDLIKEKWYNYQTSNYRPLLTPFSFTYFSIFVHFVKYTFIVIIFLVRRIRRNLRKKFDKWRKEKGDDYFLRVKETEKSIKSKLPKKNKKLENKVLLMNWKEKLQIRFFNFTYTLEIALFSILMQDFILSCGYDVLNYKVSNKGTIISILNIFLSLAGILTLSYEMTR